MHKKHSQSHMQQVVRDIVSIAYSHMADIAKELKKLEVTDENYVSLDDETKKKYNLFSQILTIINDVVHPAHKISLEMFPHAKEFIDMCILNQKNAVEKHLISDKCECYECKVGDYLPETEDGK